MALIDAGTQFGMLLDLSEFAQRFTNSGFSKAQMRDIKPQYYYDNEGLWLTVVVNQNGKTRKRCNKVSNQLGPRLAVHWS